MTYTVDVVGIVKVIKAPPEELQKDWDFFKITFNGSTATIELHGHTPWYPGVVAKMFVLGHFYKGSLKGCGEDGEKVVLQIPPTKKEIIKASDREFMKKYPNQPYSQRIKSHTDRFYEELEKIGYKHFYPKWLEEK